MEQQRLRFRADWGGANLVRAAGWLAQWVWENTPNHQLSVIETGRGMGDNLRALGHGETDIALATPAAFARLARDGRGPFEGDALPELVGIATLPHRDAMLPVARRELGIRALKDLVEYDRPLRVSIGAGDPDGFMGFGGELVLASAGISLDHFVQRGGTVTRHEQPFDVIADLRDGRADVMISEAIMTPDWQKLAEAQDVAFLSLEDDEAGWLASEYGLDTILISENYFPGWTQPIRGLNYSDWIVATTRALPDETAALLARAFIEDGEAFARSYRHLPVDYSPLRYPIDPHLARETPIPLHPAAEREYNAADNRSEVA